MKSGGLFSDDSFCMCAIFVVGVYFFTSVKTSTMMIEVPFEQSTSHFYIDACRVLVVLLLLLLC